MCKMYRGRIRFKFGNEEDFGGNRVLGTTTQRFVFILTDITFLFTGKKRQSYFESEF